MAFRGHELNLMLRVQDRASSRLRRLSTDLRGVNTAAQLQRRGATLAAQQERNLANQEKLRNARLSMSSKKGLQNIAQERKLFDLQTQRLQLMQQFAKDPSVINKRKLLATENKILDTEKARKLELTAINKEIRTSVALQAKLAAEAEATAAAFRRVAAKERVQNIGRATTHVGSVAAMVGGVGLVLGAGVSSAYANFNRQSTRAATQLRGVGEGLGTAALRGKQLETVITGMSKSFPASMSEMADSAYEISSAMNLGDSSAQRLKNTTKLLAQANRIAVAGGIDLASATESMIVVLNNFDPELKNVHATLNTLFATVKYGKGTFDQFSPVFGRMAAGAKSAHQSLKEAGGAVAFLSTKLSSQSQSVTGYVRLLQVMQRPEFVAGFKSMFGISELLPGTDKLRPLSQIIAMIVKARPQLTTGGTGLTNLIAEITARGQTVLGTSSKHPVGLQSTASARTALTQLITGWKQYAVVLHNVKVNKDEFDLSYRQMNSSPGVRWQIAINQFKAFAVILGQSVLPVMLRFIGFVQGLVRRYEALSPAMKKAITQFAAWGSIITFVLGILAVFAGSIISLVAKISLLNEKLIVTRGLLSALSVAGPIAVVIALKLIGDKKVVNWLDRHGLGFMDSRGSLTKKQVQNIDVNSPAFKLLPEFARSSIVKAKADQAANSIHDESKYGLSAVLNQHKKATASIYQEWANLTSELTGLDYLKGVSANTVQGISNIQLALAKAQSTGNQSAINTAAKNMIAFDNAAEAKLEKIKHKTPAQQKQLLQLYQNEAQMKGMLTRATDKTAASQDKLNKKHERAAAALEAAKNKVASLQLRLQGLNEQNRQMLESAFGGLFQGGLSQGPLGSMFNQLNTMLQGFGAKQIAIPVSLTLGDMNQQQKTFDQFTKDLGIVAKRVPKKHRKAFTEQLLGLGATAGLPILEGIIRGGKIGAFVKAFDKRQETITKASKTPWDVQLQASNIQYRAALLQMKAAGGKLTKAEANWLKINKSSPTVSGNGGRGTGTTRTTQSVTHHHGDTIHVHPAGDRQLTNYFSKRDWKNRRRF